MTASNEPAERERVTLPEGTLIKLRGLPFTLIEDTEVFGSEANYRLATSQDFLSCSPIPNQDPAPKSGTTNNLSPSSK